MKTPTRYRYIFDLKGIPISFLTNDGALINSICADDRVSWMYVERPAPKDSDLVWIAFVRLYQHTPGEPRFTKLKPWLG